MKKTIIEIDIKKIIGLDNEEKDNSVNYYVPFCILAENLTKEQVQIFLDYEDLINLAKLLKPYLDTYEQNAIFEQQLYDSYTEEQI